jgi:hypothetical protein
MDVKKSDNNRFNAELGVPTLSKVFSTGTHMSN